ncbi:hypothetical protein PtB15_5B220 [Puccinia triticina]|nr:hypothetical protein PtB15_5B220 [Puccinia triticina]
MDLINGFYGQFYPYSPLEASLEPRWIGSYTLLDPHGHGQPQSSTCHTSQVTFPSCMQSSDPISALLELV